MSVYKRIFIAIWVVAAVLGGTVNIGWAGESNPDTAQAVFYVHCYDVGRNALEDLPGVIEVTSGFLRGREINTVEYGPAEITVEQMATALKDAGTFSGIASQ